MRDGSKALKQEVKALPNRAKKADATVVFRMVCVRRNFDEVDDHDVCTSVPDAAVHAWAKAILPKEDHNGLKDPFHWNH